MFEETINELHQSRNSFDDKVQDSFGKSIDDNVFDPLHGELKKLEGAYAEAETKMSAIHALTMELRIIL